MLRIKLVKKVGKFLIIVVLLLIAFYLVLEKFSSNDSVEIKDESSMERIDWHDYEFIHNENNRQGPGERSGYELTDPEEIVKNEETFLTSGFSLVVSDKVSLSRALGDYRSER